MKKFGIAWKYDWWRIRIPAMGPPSRHIGKVTAYASRYAGQTSRRPIAFIEFTVCRDDADVERAKQKAQRYLNSWHRTIADSMALPRVFLE